MVDPIFALERSEEYARRKAVLQEKWRPSILLRDGKCRVCGNQETFNLHLAHITPVRTFVSKLGLEGMELAYSEDNLVMLCSACHKSQHKDLVFVTTDEIEGLRARREELRANPQIQEWLALNGRSNQLIDEGKGEAQRRLRAVEKLFTEIKEHRGWTSAVQKIGRSSSIANLPAVARFYEQTKQAPQQCTLCKNEGGYLVDKRSGLQVSLAKLESIPPGEWASIVRTCYSCKRDFYFKVAKRGRS